VPETERGYYFILFFVFHSFWTYINVEIDARLQDGKGFAFRREVVENTKGAS
jgi:hypothetical protein